MKNRYFSELLPTLAERSKLAAISALGFANVPLRRYLDEVFSRPFGSPGAFLADPAFEATFGWKTGDRSLRQLAEDGLLHPELVDAMNAPPEDLAADYRFAEDLRPYAHQVETWEILRRTPPQSVVVTSGTGSGKTECFMVPVLDSLARAKERRETLTGVRSLFLYPLNALINNQRERLRAWTSPFHGDIRFCLYNGNTPERQRANANREWPCEVGDRETLRQNPPPILVTNPTMLEYMLIRPEDEPILAQSQGKLEWIVLDEAHTYIGSQAAEAALLLRRVLLAFGMEAEQVHFIATSATIGDPAGPTGRELAHFLADIAGVAPTQVHLVAGERQCPEIGDKIRKPENTLTELEAIDPEQEISTERYRKLKGNNTARALRKLFTDSPSARLSDVCRTLFPDEQASFFSAEQQQEALRWLDLLSGTREERQKKGKKQEASESYLPLRAHLFHQTLSGLWACADPACPERKGTALDDQTWPFGKIYLEPRKHCDCGSPVYEVVRCKDCGEVYLRAEEQVIKDEQGRLRHSILAHLQETAADEFELELDLPEDEEDDAARPVADPFGRRIHYLIVNRAGRYGQEEEVGDAAVKRDSRAFADPGPDTLSLQVYEGVGGDLYCPACNSKRPSSFYPSRLGAHYLLNTILPTLLEYAPDSGDKPADLPWRGHRLLTFNDSRQGTARMAILLQQEAERNLVRSLCYHYALQHGQTADDGQLVLLKQQIKVQEDALAEFVRQNNEALAKPLAAIIQQLKAQLAQLLRPNPIPFAALAEKLTYSGTDFKRMLASYQRLTPYTFDASGDLARMLLVREFGRRPQFQNNLETMGMVAVRYPEVDIIGVVPQNVQWAFGLEEWRDFLKLALDFTARANSALTLGRDFRRWLGVMFTQSWLVEPDRQNRAGNQRFWPQVRRSGLRSKLVRLLAHVLELDYQTAAGEDQIDAILQSAWQTLIDKRILQLTSDGYVLPLEQLAFAPIREAWVCPITRRFLDVTLRGVTPYLPEHPQNKESVLCQKMQMPVYDEPFGGNTDPQERVRRGREWIQGQPGIAELREQGLWSDLNDRVIETVSYFRAAEHSAQQPADILEQYESQFKQGKINILSCSTTMEMGIDIGGISEVAMNNVPPHPANYLQRAGRAGRRREGRSVALTLCKANPLDQQVFADARWAFDARLPAPRVALDSRVIVHRHLHSFLLNAFLARPARDGLNQLKLRCGDFWSKETGLADRFDAWCRDFSPEDNPELAAAMRRIVRFSALDGQSPTQWTLEAADSMRGITERWRREWENLDNERQECRKEAGEKAPITRALEFRIKRLEGEYLPRELATQGWLPAYGFPAHIAAFDNLTVDQFKAQRRNVEGREDNRFQRRDLPSRDLVTALREYAPGAEVVMNGCVYRSAGITLNWHIPAAQQDVREIQNIRVAWRCDQCGASGSSFRSISKQTQCEACGKEIDPRHIREFLEPAGFAVDFYSSAHNDVSRQQFVPVEAPWVNANGTWTPLANPALGRFRVTTRGHLFHHSRGLNGTGYAICLQCGRAEPMTPGRDLPPVFQNRHRKLRRSRDDGAFCPGEDWSIKQGISLGHEIWTDMVELQLKNRDGVWLNNRVVAATLAVALRDRLAERLGVETGELGCVVKPARPESGNICQSIMIYDNYAAGYASRAGDMLPGLFARIAEKLQCPQNCDSACPHCILNFDQRFAADSLDRHAALRWLEDDWLNELRLPEDLSFFGAESRPEFKSLGEAVLSALGREGGHTVRFYTGGAYEEWQVATSLLRRLAYRLAGQDIDVEIALPPGCQDHLDALDRHSLAALADAPHIKVFECEAETLPGGFLLAETVGGPRRSRWAVREETSLAFAPDWGKTAEILVRGETEAPPASRLRPLTAVALRPVLHTGDRVLEVSRELNGSLRDFGHRFWNFVMDGHDAVRAALNDASLRVASVGYSDRYLVTPLTAALFAVVMAALRDIVGPERFGTAPVELLTWPIAGKEPDEASWEIWHNWPENEVRNGVLRHLFSENGLKLNIHDQDKNAAPHHRALTVRFTSGKGFVLLLDQGLAYWRADIRDKSFDFSAEAPKQGLLLKLMIANEANRVREGSAYPTSLVITKVTC